MKLSTTLIGVVMILLTTQNIYSQGCVAIRGNTSCGAQSNLNVPTGKLNLNVGYRYFKSFRHFRGDHEETNRIEEGTNVINKSHFVDLGLNYNLNDRVYFNLLIPFVSHNRSSMYEHGGNPPNGLGERHITTSQGIADVRLGGGYWFKPISSMSKWNSSIGAGIKLPSGSADYNDLFYNQGANKDEDIEKVVDQSIQPGDGGWAFYLEGQTFYQLSNKLGLNASYSYLFSFMETNGVLTRNGSSEFSCPDQYSLTTGLSFFANHSFNFYLGGRLEGVPASDIIGGDSGYRRPGYVVSAEPGVGYTSNNIFVNLSVPVALYRNRTQSYQDKVRTLETGNYRHGDAAFADYLINLSVSYTLVPGKPMMEHHDSDM